VEWTTTNVLCEDAVVGRIMKAAASPVGITVAVDAGLSPPRRPPTHGYESTREAAMAVFLGLPWGYEQITPRQVGDQAQASDPHTTISHRRNLVSHRL
jgi:hypothetical protein